MTELKDESLFSAEAYTSPGRPKITWSLATTIQGSELMIDKAVAFERFIITEYCFDAWPDVV